MIVCVCKWFQTSMSMHITWIHVCCSTLIDRTLTRCKAQVADKEQSLAFAQALDTNLSQALLYKVESGLEEQRRAWEAERSKQQEEVARWDEAARRSALAPPQPLPASVGESLEREAGQVADAEAVIGHKEEESRLRARFARVEAVAAADALLAKSAALGANFSHVLLHLPAFTRAGAAAGKAGKAGEAAGGDELEHLATDLAASRHAASGLAQRQLAAWQSMEHSAASHRSRFRHAIAAQQVFLRVRAQACWGCWHTFSTLYMFWRTRRCLTRGRQEAMDKGIEEQHRLVARLVASEHAADQDMARTVSGLLPRLPIALALGLFGVHGGSGGHACMAAINRAFPTPWRPLARAALRPDTACP